MKKLFNRTKRPAQEWEGYDESEYDWDRAEDSMEEAAYEEESGEEYYYQDNGFTEDENAYYVDGEEVTDAEYYAGGEETTDVEYYADGEETADTESYAAEEAGGVYYDSQIGDNAEYAEADYYEDGEYYEGGYEAAIDSYEQQEDEAYAGYGLEEDTEPVVIPVGRNGGRNGSFLSKLQRGLASMSVMDRVILAMGVGVLILALITGSVYASAKIVDRQVSSFVSVGTQLDSIEVIGGAGLLAVADAQMAKLAAAGMLDLEDNKGYDEGEYEKEVTVALEMVSIQKDLKVKFVNQRTDKLIANVPFAVIVTDPDGNTSVWSDDDMDGIIYKKDITPGDYQVAMEPLTDSKYADYIITSSAEKVTVKKDIDYKKVNVANEVKTESQVNAQKEDTKKNETQVESTLQDTVTWVESRVTGASYNEVAKSSIPDPMTLLALNKVFMRAVEDVSGGNAEPSTSTETTAPTETPTQTATPTPTETPTPTATPNLVTSLTSPKVSVVIGGTAASQASVKGADGFDVKYVCSGGDSAIATASIDESTGAITVKGVAAGTTSFSVTAECQVNGQTVSSPAAKLEVTVAGNKSLTLDKTALTVFTEVPAKLTATIANAVAENPELKVESSDTGVATASVDNKTVTISGVKAGTATITVSFTENNETVEATCTVTVKEHPKNDRINKLKDSNGTQLYVNENGTYREAVYADFYNTSLKFYVRGESKYQGWQTIDGKVYFFTADGKKVTGEQVIQGAKYNFASDGSLVQGSNGAMGIDVSKWNGTIDWSAVKNSGVNFVIIRCGYRGSSEGSLIEDPKFTANIKGATAAGLKVGIYFFTQAIDEREAVEEASMVLNQVKNYTISYPIFLDVEPSGGRADSISMETRTAVCKAFCQTIQNEGYTAGIYANKTWLNTKIDASALSAYKIWLAQYASTPSYTGRYDLWQYRATGKVSGISGDVDMNLSYLGY